MNPVPSTNVMFLLILIVTLYMIIVLVTLMLTDKSPEQIPEEDEKKTDHNELDTADVYSLDELKELGKVVVWRGGALGRYYVGIVGKLGQDFVEGQYVTPVNEDEFTGGAGWSRTMNATNPWLFTINREGERGDDRLLARDVVASDVQWHLPDSSTTTTVFQDGNRLSEAEHKALIDMSS